MCTGMEILAADPDYQRMGIGNKLLQAGFDIADKLGLTEAYIEASQAGYPLYRKWGWEDVDAIIIDKSKYGGKELHNTICMVRKKPLEEK
jgi:N-acetylglutamate synthase-like GNAT family acetyltransferase